MIFKLIIDRQHPEEIVATVHERTPIIDEIERLIQQIHPPDQLPAYLDDDIYMLKMSEIECFYAENEKTFAVYSDGKRYWIRKRLYALEEMLPANFDRISKSAIANRNKIAVFKVQLSGAVNAVFESGYVECISRRCFAELKRRYGL